MSTAEITQHLKITVGGVVKEFGSTTVPVEMDITNDYVYEVRTVIPENYLDEVLWTTGDGAIDTFELLWFVSDADVFLELRNTMATDEFIVIECKADVPILISSDDIGGHDSGATRFDDAQQVEGTDYDQADQISVQRNVAAAGGDALVHLVLLA